MLLSRLQDVVRLVDSGYRDAHEIAFSGAAGGLQAGRSSTRSDPTGGVAACGCSRPEDADPKAPIEHHCLPVLLKAVAGDVMKAIAILRGSDLDLKKFPKRAPGQRDTYIKEDPRVGNLPGPKFPADPREGDVAL